jgi:hypothetical protein
LDVIRVVHAFLLPVRQDKNAADLLSHRKCGTLACMVVKDDNFLALFDEVASRLEGERAALNAADPINGNHGDHMVEIFQTVSQFARQGAPQDLPGAMEDAARSLRAKIGNGSAQVYALALEQFAAQFREHNISASRLLAYIRDVLDEESDRKQKPEGMGEVLKALVGGLSGWDSAQQDGSQGRGAKMGYLFDLGIAYLQAKQRGGSRAEILADAAATASPLKNLLHRELSGKIAIQSLLEAIQNAGSSADTRSG